MTPDVWIEPGGALVRGEGVNRWGGFAWYRVFPAGGTGSHTTMSLNPYAIRLTPEVSS